MLLSWPRALLPSWTPRGPTAFTNSSVHGARDLGLPSERRHDSPRGRHCLWFYSEDTARAGLKKAFQPTGFLNQFVPSCRIPPGLRSPPLGGEEREIRRFFCPYFASSAENGQGCLEWGEAPWPVHYSGLSTSWYLRASCGTDCMQTAIRSL